MLGVGGSRLAKLEAQVALSRQEVEKRDKIEKELESFETDNSILGKNLSKLYPVARDSRSELSNKVDALRSQIDRHACEDHITLAELKKMKADKKLLNERRKRKQEDSRLEADGLRTQSQKFNPRSTSSRDYVQTSNSNTQSTKRIKRRHHHPSDSYAESRHNSFHSASGGYRSRQDYQARKHHTKDSHRSRHPRVDDNRVHRSSGSKRHRHEPRPHSPPHHRPSHRHRRGYESSDAPKHNQDPRLHRSHAKRPVRAPSDTTKDTPSHTSKDAQPIKANSNREHGCAKICPITKRNPKHSKSNSNREHGCAKIGPTTKHNPNHSKSMHNGQLSPVPDSKSATETDVVPTSRQPRKSIPDRSLNREAKYQSNQNFECAGRGSDAGLDSKFDSNMHRSNVDVLGSCNNPRYHNDLNITQNGPRHSQLPRQPEPKIPPRPSKPPQKPVRPTMRPKLTRPPVIPPKPTKPPKPTTPAKLMKPRKPTEPRKRLSKPVRPTKPTIPVKPFKPARPTKLAQPNKPVKPVKPPRPTKLLQPSKPVKPSKPHRPTLVKLNKPVKPIKPHRPTKLAQPNKHVKPIKPSRPTKLPRLNKTVKSSKPPRSTKVTKLSRPVKPTKLAKSLGSVKAVGAKQSLHLTPLTNSVRPRESANSEKSINQTKLSTTQDFVTSSPSLIHSALPVPPQIAVPADVDLDTSNTPADADLGTLNTPAGVDFGAPNTTSCLVSGDPTDYSMFGSSDSDTSDSDSSDSELDWVPSRPRSSQLSSEMTTSDQISSINSSVPSQSSAYALQSTLMLQPAPVQQSRPPLTSSKSHVNRPTVNQPQTTGDNRPPVKTPAVSCAVSRGRIPSQRSGSFTSSETLPKFRVSSNVGSTRTRPQKLSSYGRPPRHQKSPQKRVDGSSTLNPKRVAGSNVRSTLSSKRVGGKKVRSPLNSKRVRLSSQACLDKDTDSDDEQLLPPKKRTRVNRRSQKTVLKPPPTAPIAVQRRQSQELALSDSHLYKYGQRHRKQLLSGGNYLARINLSNCRPRHISSRKSTQSQLSPSKQLPTSSSKRKSNSPQRLNTSHRSSASHQKQITDAACHTTAANPREMASSHKRKVSYRQTLSSSQQTAPLRQPATSTSVKKAKIGGGSPLPETPKVRSGGGSILAAAKAFRQRLNNCENVSVGS